MEAPHQLGSQSSVGPFLIRIRLRLRLATVEYSEGTKPNRRTVLRVCVWLPCREGREGMLLFGMRVTIRSDQEMGTVSTG